MSRDCSVIMTRVWQDYFLNTGKLTVKSWPKIFFIYRGGITESWRPSEIFFSRLPKDMEKWLEEDKKNERVVLKQLNNYFKYAPQLRSYKAKAKNVKQIIKEIEIVIKTSEKASSGLVLGYWMRHWHEELKIVNYPKIIINLGNKLRLTDSLFDDSNEIVYQLLQKLSRLIYVPYQHLKLLNLGEIKRLVNAPDSNILSKVIKQRQSGYFFYNSKIYSLDEIGDFLKKNGLKLIQEKTLQIKNQLNGQAANPGRIKGVVRIVLNREEAHKLKKGDILVAAMTTPWYLPIMKIAAGFITDEGGVMSHAAIIARELNKPCVVGAKIATKVLKDGDIVEVDATKGLVRKV